MDGGGLQQWRRDAFLYSQDDSFLDLETHSGRAQLVSSEHIRINNEYVDGLHGVLHLEESSLRRERVDSSVVVTSSQKHTNSLFNQSTIVKMPTV